MGLLPIVLNSPNCPKLSQIAPNYLKLPKKKATPMMGLLPIVLNCLRLSLIVGKKANARDVPTSHRPKLPLIASNCLELS